ncbi:squamous cell carcinoma antigen recognized by T-cells 3 [Herrania umbratica]|uniref:Squamous cell carcinoma antigen recognized by T-cells 3 n=1 Tax=Herrania umbratica TaxID=108875 RepID=A0A6J1BJN6_9ROSI|nr:squamous cell carcinoma antigen recognized by T-cells 3 [Herrania umbratica]
MKKVDCIKGISEHGQKKKKGEKERKREMEEVEKSPISTEEEDAEMREGDVVENPKTSSKSSSDSESSDSEDEAEQIEQLQTLESELSTNPSNYDAHVQYIKLLRKRGEIEKLREARENMNALFPLSPSMWVEWAKDEASLSDDSGFEAVEKLYEKGISEYLSVSLWCEYLNYVQEHDPKVRQCSADGISKARNLFERAVTAAALHVAQGFRIWDAYTQFEQAILLTIDHSDIQAKEKQVQRVRSIFHRHLSIPLANLRSTLFAYKAWEVEQGNALDSESDTVDGISSHVASAYQKAEEMYNARAHHEEQITRQDISESERFQHFMSYLEYEQSFGDPARVQILYERAITDFPDLCHAWLRFEREFGTLEDLDHALQKVTPRLKELQLFRLQQESKSVIEATDQREQTSQKTAREKRKSGSSAIDEQSPAKRQKNTSQYQKKLHEKENTQGKNVAEANDGEEKKGKVDKQVNEQQMKDTDPGKTRLYTDQCTVFISNLDYKAKYEDLRQFFSDVGGITSMRILHDRFTGKSRGLAYVDFVDDEHLAAAVMKNKQMLHGKKLSIARSNPKQRKKESFVLNAPGGHVDASSNRSGIDGSSASKESVESPKGSRVPQSTASKRVENFQLKGKNTFAVPRNVRPLGWTSNKPETREEGDEKPKSNDEFRKMFMKT